MRFLLTSIYNKKASNCSIITTDILKKYCNRNYYDCIIDNYEFEDPFEKINYLLKLFNQYKHIDYFVWVDSDIIILNENFKLESILNNKEIQFSSDGCGLCSGFFIIKNDQWCEQILKTIQLLKNVSLNIELNPTYPNGGFVKYQNKYEQNSFKILAYYYKEFSKNISLIDECIIQNPSSLFNKNAFAFHFWSNGWTNQDRMIKCINKIKSNGYTPLNNWWEL